MKRILIHVCGVVTCIVLLVTALVPIRSRLAEKLPPVPENQLFTTTSVFNGGVELQSAETGERRCYGRSHLDDHLPSVFYISDRKVMKVTNETLGLKPIPPEWEGKYIK